MSCRTWKFCSLELAKPYTMANRPKRLAAFSEEQKRCKVTCGRSEVSFNRQHVGIYPHGPAGLLAQYAAILARRSHTSPGFLLLQLTILTLSASTTVFSILKWTFSIKKVQTSSQKRYVSR